MLNEIKNEFISKLQNYIYMDEIPDIKVGSFIRWIPLSNPDKIILTRGGNICDINITDKGTSIVVKNYFGKGMQVSMDKALIFRKLNDDEPIKNLNYLKNTDEIMEKISVSIGVAFEDSTQDNIYELIQKADADMYRMKKETSKDYSKEIVLYATKKDRYIR